MQIPPRKILIIRFSSIGDIVLTTPVVRCLKLELPALELHFLTKKQFLPLLEANSYIRKVWLYDHNFPSLIPQLQSEGFDYVVDLHKNYRSFYVRWKLGLKSGTFSKLNVQKWLIVNLKMNLLPPVHIVDRYMKTISALGIHNDGIGLNYFIPENAGIDPVTLPETFRRSFIAIVIGGKHNTKIFPVEKVIEVCKKLTRPVILLGGNEDRDRGERIVTAAGPAVFNTCGRYSLNQSASLIRNADAVMTNDTGLMHIAAAFHKRIVSVWGNTIPEFGMFPYLTGEEKTNSLIAEVKGLSCRPCSKLGYDACPKKHFRCMNDIDIHVIVDFLNKK
ncbi:MAG: glycosyltransferase family 9 protein [Bacteroidales bacterium]|jgi:heptosyltransferase-2|nr:glycosyltransferase family 9 protein [Bacteroidales bacterium]